jgi:hypothetical protein
MKCQCGGLLKKIKTGMVCRRCYLFYPKPRTKEEIEILAKDVLALHKPDKDCVFTTELDCVATNQCQSKTPNIKKT